MCQPFFFYQFLNMTKSFCFIFGLLLLACSSSTQESQVAQEPQLKYNLKSGNWRFSLQLGDKELPFIVQLHLTDQPTATIHNQSETITVENIAIRNDSIFLDLPIFPSILAGKIESPDLIIGHWVNKSKENYTIPFVAEYGKDFRFTSKPAYDQIQNSYKVKFDTKGENPWDAILKIKNHEGALTGTFLTETGDYRYLEGNIVNKRIYLSTFDGSHAFYFSAQIKNDSLIDGLFLSGNHYSTDWKAAADESFELRKPEQLTFLNEGYSQFDFNLPNQDGDTVSWSDLNLDNKVVIVDIMGSWCPNCIDAKKALMELTKEYSLDKVEILTIACETTNDLNVAKTRLNKMNSNLNNPDTDFIFAGHASKSQTAALFPMLSEISSYPTLIFIDKSQNIKQIYTGFYGPGTGSYYDDFMSNTEKLLVEMVADTN